MSLTILNRVEESKLSAFAKRAVSALKDNDSAFTPDQIDFLAKTSELAPSEVREAELSLRVFFLKVMSCANIWKYLDVYIKVQLT